MAVVSREDENGAPSPSNVNAATASTSSAQGSTTAQAARSSQETVPTVSDSSLPGTSSTQDATLTQPPMAGMQSQLFVPQTTATIQVSSQVVMQSIHYNTQYGANYTPHFVVTGPAGMMRPCHFLRGQPMLPYMMNPMQYQPGQMQFIATEYPQSVTVTHTMLMQSVEYVPPYFTQNNIPAFFQPIGIPYSGTVYFTESTPMMNVGTRALYSVRDYTSYTRESQMAGPFPSEDDAFSGQIQSDYGTTWQNDSPRLSENNPPRIRHGPGARRGQASSTEHAHSYNTPNVQHATFQSQSATNTPSNGGHNYGGASSAKHGKKQGMKGQGHDKSKSSAGQKKDKSKCAAAAATTKEQASVSVADAADATSTGTASMTTNTTSTKIQRASSGEGKGQVEKRERAYKGSGVTWADVAAIIPPAQKPSDLNDSSKQDQRTSIKETEPSSGDAATPDITTAPAAVTAAASAADGNAGGPSTSQATTTSASPKRSRRPQASHQDPKPRSSQELEDVEQQLERTALRNALQVLEDKDDQ